MSKLKAILGDTVMGKEGAVSVDTLTDYDLVGVYFSAHWCPPCRGFTPVLAEFYKKMNANNKKFEIVFVSSDRDKGSFDNYYGEMPWLCIDFDNADKKGELGQKYGVSGIPCLVLLNKNGELVTKDGREKVCNSPDGFPWS